MTIQPLRLDLFFAVNKSRRNLLFLRGAYQRMNYE